MFGKLNEIAQKAEEVKAELEAVIITKTSLSGKFTVSANGRKRLLEIKMNQPGEVVSNELNTELKDLINQALSEAETVGEEKMRSIMSDLMPGLGGFGMLGKLFK